MVLLLIQFLCFIATIAIFYDVYLVCRINSFLLSTCILRTVTDSDRTVKIV